MKLTANPTSASVKGGESTDQREARMKEFWSSGAGSQYVPLGKILNAHTAQLLIDGAILELDTVEYLGVSLPVSPVQVVSLKTVPSWGCPACHSAHGTGTGPSPEPTIKGLMSNVFSYSLVTKQVFAVSASCRSLYAFDAVGRLSTSHAVTSMTDIVRPTLPDAPVKVDGQVGTEARATRRQIRAAKAPVVDADSLTDSQLETLTTPDTVEVV